MFVAKRDDPNEIEESRSSSLELNELIIPPGKDPWCNSHSSWFIMAPGPFSPQNLGVAIAKWRLKPLEQRQQIPWLTFHYTDWLIGILITTHYNPYISGS